MAQPQEPPRSFGVLLFPGFQALDAFGSLDILNVLSERTPLSLAMISSSLDPVSTTPPGTISPTFGQSVVPTHTFTTCPALDVLIIPGGVGTKGPNIQSTIDFVKTAKPKYIFTICTGAVIAASAGVLDGKRATSNKSLWSRILGFTEVHWVSHARWVVDGNVWTSSGVTAGMDAMLAFVEEFYGAEAAEHVTNELEYERHRDPSWDPFAALYNLE
ncbi:class I glutamine amidotransferase-like protein [Mycena floridula]|nr:class I glutamine amidotransferase-like protein [Mycena floridula]